MSYTFRDYPLGVYVEMLDRREPFVSVLFGDGELSAMLGDRDGKPFTHYDEVVTPVIRQRMEEILDDPNPNIYKGTDRHLIEWWTYAGQDKESLVALAKRFNPLLENRHVDWVDGVVWDTAMREGKLGPFLRAVREFGGERTTLVANQPLVQAVKYKIGLAPKWSITIPRTNALAKHDSIYDACAQAKSGLYLLCAGLGAVPLAQRLHADNPEATIIDLGSVLDIFARIGEERGWRQELYADDARYADVLRRNLECLD